ncbi:MAG: glycosyltransferase family 39 protein, partial [Magnetococcales bacterium]|nr:glycosyltransferase family 39 protein [Magnetococcales bacterium]
MMARLVMVLLAGAMLLSGVVVRGGEYLERAALQEWLAEWTDPFLRLLLLLILLAVLFNREGLAALWGRLPRNVRRGLPLVCLGGMAATALLAPSTHRIYYDETIYLNIAQNMAQLGQTQMCNSGGTEYGIYRCDRPEYNKQPNGYPFLVSLVYRLFGVSERVAFLFNNFLLGLAALTVLFIAREISGSWRGAGIAAAAVVLNPQNLHWYNTTAAEPAAAVTTALVVLAALWHRRQGGVASLFLLTVLLAFSGHFRPESLLIAPVVLLLLWRSLKAPEVPGFLVLLVLLLLPLALHGAVFHGHPWGSSGKPYSFDYLSLNLQVNLGHYFENRHFPFVWTFLALAGLILPGEGLGRRLAVGLWFLLFWGVFLFFYAGSYAYGADVRYALVSALPLAVLAGGGGGGVCRPVERRFP